MTTRTIKKTVFHSNGHGIVMGIVKMPQNGGSIGMSRSSDVWEYNTGCRKQLKHPKIRFRKRKF